MTVIIATNEKEGKVKRVSSSHRVMYGVGVILPLVVISLLLVLVAHQPVAQGSSPQIQPPQSYLAVPSPVGTQPVLPTLPPLPPVPSVGPSEIVPDSPSATAVSTVVGQSQENSVQILRQATFGSWSYKAKRVGNEQPSVEVHVDTGSVGAIQAFIAVNKQYADQLAATGGTAIVRVVFRQPMDVDAYRVWAKGSGIAKFEIVCLPGSDLHGGPSGSLCVYPMSSDPLPEEAFAQAKKGLRTVQGVYFIKGTIAAALLPTLVADPHILVADLTDNMVQRDLNTAGITAAANVVVSNDMPTLTVIKMMADTK